MSEHTYKFDVKMTCSGCSNAVTRALEKTKTNETGISEYSVSLEKQEVIVKGTMDYDGVLAKIKKTGKEKDKWDRIAGDKRDAALERLPPPACQSGSFVKDDCNTWLEG
ncbi:hypothetical protein FISHEDRAFT_62501 [Fistulina hepatica ATCC 64428]|nr:hypothetical protein FISHEDRAFT_62501 [Fistulina hepatica ATCC 64428]